jgi:hypothetical protein
MSNGREKGDEDGVGSMEERWHRAALVIWHIGTCSGLKNLPNLNSTVYVEI